jgi:hypothetical protein
MDRHHTAAASQRQPFIRSHCFSCMPVTVNMRRSRRLLRTHRHHLPWDASDRSRLICASRVRAEHPFGVERTAIVAPWKARISGGSVRRGDVAEQSCCVMRNVERAGRRGPAGWRHSGSVRGTACLRRSGACRSGATWPGREGRCACRSAGCAVEVGGDRGGSEAVRPGDPQCRAAPAGPGQDRHC